jgi:soluble lytic murein transglycosylase-like protein
MQLMPATAARFGVKNICDPAENIEGGAKYLRWLLNYFGGDYTLALAGYNAGEGAVMKFGRRVPPYAETVNYVSNIQRMAMIYRGAPGALRLTASSLPVAAQPAPVTNEVPARTKLETGSTYFWN